MRLSCRQPAFPLTIAVIAGLLAGCSAIDKPTRPSMYDFGPGVPTPSAAAATPVAQTLPPMAIADISTAGGAIENQAVLYRLAYTDAQELRPYSQARWSMPPAQLVNKRMRELLGQRRVVENVALGAHQRARCGGTAEEHCASFHHGFCPSWNVGGVSVATARSS